MMGSLASAASGTTRGDGGCSRERGSMMLRKANTWIYSNYLSNVFLDWALPQGEATHS